MRWVRQDVGVYECQISKWEERAGCEGKSHKVSCTMVLLKRMLMHLWTSRYVAMAWKDKNNIVEELSPQSK